MKLRACLGGLMQSAPTTSPWPKRILITGVILAACGILSVAFSGDQLTDYYDPRVTSEETAQYGEVNTFVLDAGCWVVNVEGEDSDYIVSYQYIEDGAAGDAIDDDCRSDFQPQVSDTNFSTVDKLDIEKESEILVTISCETEDGCTNPLLFTNGDVVVIEMLTDPVLWMSGGLCCVGLIFIPLGWMLVMINRGRNAGVQLITNQHLGIDTPLDQDLSPKKEILTTDELYQLVRGEIPTIEENGIDVPGPFANADTRIRKPDSISVGGSINKASVHTPENPPTDDSWKNWDES